MMLIMPVVMTLFFLNFQSGLVLYWLTSNVLQIGQQALMNRMMKAKKGEIAMENQEKSDDRPDGGSPGIQGEEPGRRHPPRRAQAEDRPDGIRI